MIPVDDPDDPRLDGFRVNERALASRPQRRSDAGAGLFLAEGDLVVERTLDAGYVPIAALADHQHLPSIAHRLAETVPVYVASTSVRRALTGLGVPAPILTLFERRERPPLEQLAARSRRLVIVEGVDNPVNVGSIVRNAAGLGWDGLVLDQTSADPLARRALRTSMGHAATLAHARTADLVAAVGTLTAAGWTVCALTPSADARALDTVGSAERLAVVIGAERTGISPSLLAAATHRIKIPMAAGVDSLNAAAASAIACYALRPRT